MRKIAILFALTALSSFNLKAQIIWSTNSNGINYNGGNVGIGTAVPTAKLEVAGKIFANSGSNAESIISANGGREWQFIARANGNSTFAIRDNSIGADRLNIDLNGNVGIGTTTPPYKLVVSNAGGLGLEFDPSGVQYNEGFGMQVYNRSTSNYQPLQIYASKILLNGGNVGIGTTTPENKLVITGGTTRIDGSYKLAFGSSNGGLHAINASSATTVGTLDFTQFMGSGWRTTMSLDAATGNVGIGTTTPATSLDVVRRSLGQLAKFSEHSDQVAINGESYISVGYSPINLGYHYVSGDSYGFLEMNGGSRAIVIKKNGNVGIGVTNPQYKFTVEGTIAAREVKVTAEPWADFVFHPTYKLRTLGEVEQFIKSNSHLPEIPTAAEVKENGVSLGEMNAKLLQKVEELTLYLIEQQKVNEKQNQLIKMLEQKIEEIITKQ